MKIFASLFLLTSAVWAQDVKGCQDSPLVGRFPGSIIIYCSHKDDDSFAFTLDGNKNKKLEGDLTKIRYQFPKSASKAQVVRNMNTAIRRAGYTFVYDSGDYGDFTVYMGNTWIQIEIGGGGTIEETILKIIDLKQEVFADAAALSSGLASNGHMVVNGILFDTGKADVKPESSTALDEVVKMMKADAKVKIFVVGHTDNVGPAAANLDLSRRRAAAVVQLLTAKYGIAAERLSAFGNGPYAPVSSNDSEDGRALNRRVELVKQ